MRNRRACPTLMYGRIPERRAYLTHDSFLFNIFATSPTHSRLPLLLLMLTSGYRPRRSANRYRQAWVYLVALKIGVVGDLDHRQLPISA